MLTYVVENFNQTSVKNFFLLGLSDVFELKIVYSILLTFIYIITLTINFLLIALVRINDKLQTPMYFFLSNLSVIDACLSSSVIPKILANTLSEDKSISFLGCAIQLYSHIAFGGTECLLLALMSYDRYTAICKPLQYTIILNKQLCLHLAIGCWVASFVNSVILTAFTFRLSYCGSNHLNHFFCEMPLVLRLACQNVRLSELVEYISVGLFLAGTLTLILMSYLRITLTVLKIRTNIRPYKAFSTCVSHLTVVSLSYGIALFMHMHPRSSYSPKQDQILGLLYTVLTPMLNPIIYSIRNEDIKNSVRKALHVHLL